MLSDERFRNANLDDHAKAAFFASGEEHVAAVLKQCQERFGVPPTLGRCLDFGCGTGRLVLPFARRFAQVTGVDVSPTMLAEARVNCTAAQLGNVDLVHGDDALSAVSGTYDFIHSFIVFQHIPVDRGLALIERLVGMLAVGGQGMLHLTYSKSKFRRPRYHQRYGVAPNRWYLAPVRGLGRILRKLRGHDPEMQMNQYHLGQIFYILQSTKIHKIATTFTDDGRFCGVMISLHR